MRPPLTGHATSIIAGLAVGLHASTAAGILHRRVDPDLYHFHGLYGVAIVIVSMLSLSGIIISLDAFGPITDNAGGIAVMSKPRKSWVPTNSVPSATLMKAVTKGYAIASAGLAALVLFRSYIGELNAHADRPSPRAWLRT